MFGACHGLRWLRRAGWAGAADERHGVSWTPDRLRVLKLELGTNRVEGESGLFCCCDMILVERCGTLLLFFPIARGGVNVMVLA